VFLTSTDICHQSHLSSAEMRLRSSFAFPYVYKKAEEKYVCFRFIVGVLSIRVIGRGLIRRVTNGQLLRCNSFLFYYMRSFR
jgi:hypothetical protein